MPFQLGPRRVVVPDGVEWRVGWRWLSRRPRLGRPTRGEIASESLSNIGVAWPDLGNLDLGEGLLVIAGVVAVALILIPILFGIELIIVGRAPSCRRRGTHAASPAWIVEARSSDSLTSGRLWNGGCEGGGSPAS
jgi:hypothetical protein